MLNRKVAGAWLFKVDVLVSADGALHWETFSCSIVAHLVEAYVAHVMTTLQVERPMIGATVLVEAHRTFVNWILYDLTLHLLVNQIRL